VTPFDQVPAETLARLEPLIAKYVTAAGRAG
jgi:hypothetical protein